MQKTSTFTLLRNMCVKTCIFSDAVKNPITRLFIALIVDVWDSKTKVRVFEGRKTYQNTAATVTPKKRYMKLERAFECSFRRNFSSKSCKSFSSSIVIVL